MNSFASRLKLPYRAGAIGLSIGTLLVMVVASVILLPDFMDPENLSNLLAQSTVLVISALGQTFVILTGGLDVSVGSVISLTTTIMTLDLPEITRVLICIAVAMGFGVANGYGVARLNVHPIIMTLTTMGIGQGIALIILPIPGGRVPEWLSGSVAGSIGPVPNSLFWLITASLFASWILYRRPFGLYLFASGGNDFNARMNGVPVERTIIKAYVLSALFACAAGMFLAGRLASGDPKGGASFGIESVTAAALGGVHLAGGIGSIVGTVVGAAILGTVNNVMNLANVSAFLQSVVKGVLLLVLVVSQRRKTIGL
ncbi:MULTISPECIES: ABC transporter permease [Rhizobium]|jgi:ribose transport system permease protein|uniref:Sugar ABC transporter, permease protein n=15 Tax=Rhizobium TaxID=379 RepID=Q8KIM2_RHIEC|nr:MULTISPECIES: ABC transporter permease [Rhizobium]ACE93858.1 sugar ABC transporter, permease protein [Rhizobium etli CIAT 652]AJC82279.1 sugar ABC transporter permease protein [Rhizobium etli bv. phaseoli str. IE4803]EGE60399.1 sugar ABC transporter, permease protein [Rhizobium etli CNPAF512]KEC70723.1 sugar ABC transporter permease [Rhizobium leguminosarum bv. phaseoli CCGM1]TCU19670.1 monosaccharide ABC transporter membrane protein (CUT2 family) [Rhizobium azibense]